MQMNLQYAIGASALCALAGQSLGQDSVAATPGASDALAAYDAASQRVRYVVDLAPITSSWNNPFAIAPVLKTSADPDPMFDTQLVGAVALSPDLTGPVALGSPQDFQLWTTAGQGVNPTANAAPGTTQVASFDHQFGLALADLSASATNAIGATIGLTSEADRLYVTRTIGVSSRFNAVSQDLATLSLGAIDADGALYLRADDFNAPDANAIDGDNILRVLLDARNTSGVNAVVRIGGANIVTDAASSDYLVNDSAVTLNTPSCLPGSLGAARGVILDFAGNYTNATPGASTSTTDHLQAAIEGQRGNPYVSTAAALPSFDAYLLSLGKTVVDGPTNSINAARLMADGSVVSAVRRTLPMNITDGAGFTTNAVGDAEFVHYQSQQSFRGSNGQAAAGVDPISGARIAAATAQDPTDGQFIAVANITLDSNWTVAAYEGKDVLDGENGSPIGTIASAAPASISAPAIDADGNIYFVCAFEPTAGPTANALIKAVNTASGYQLELLVQEGDTVAGANSATSYTIDRLTLADSDSLASGSFYASSVLQSGAGGAGFGGAAIGAQITYDNAGTSETYDAVLFLAESAGTEKICLGDCDGNGSIDFNDLVSMLFVFGQDTDDGCDADENATVDFNDLVATLFLFGPCP
ncbi:unnamed protein product [Symbiodinium necroappetens]|uniref:EF-hand domain-containing protein n=1 Tax=Symbiodinium necroappetens TaxID=1628268 RepID=A0A813BAR1_9DINO|nr:unnamed protein product [Symbiodinium necroappetens]